jgi:pyruvate/2-oxoglutarate dehydrogenase complex dihydrolipoamide acyltransferase (E2) component
MAPYRMSTRRKLAIATWSAPREANIYGKLTVDATQALAYIEFLRARTGEKVTITHLVGKAAGVALAQTPTLNGRVVLGRFVPFTTVDLAFLVALEDGQDLAKAKVCDVDKKSLSEIAAELRERSQRLRKGGDSDFEKSKGAIRALPTWLLKPVVELTGFLAGGLGLKLPALGVEPFPFGSCIVTSVGMFGLDEGYVPPTPFARVPLYVLVGAVKDRPTIEGDKVVSRPQLTITATIDHRFIDGAQLGTVAKVVRSVLEDPWQLEPPENRPQRA